MSYAPPGWVEDCRCSLCGTACYPPWLTSDETWMRIMGDSQQQICIGCFYERANPSECYLTVALGGDGNRELRATQRATPPEEGAG
jgi:hypothetical protein